MPETIRLNAHLYQQYDCDPTAKVPAEAMGGWREETVPLSLEHTALVVMHAWDLHTAEEFPGWWRGNEGNDRTMKICREVFPPILKAVRASPLKIYHVVGCGNYYSHLPDYQSTAAMAPKFEWWPSVKRDPVYEELKAIKADRCDPGKHNAGDMERAFKTLDFAEEARSLAGEPVAESTPQLFALCNRDKVNHLVYIGFALNWCVQSMPCGMIDMKRHGVMCSTIQQATTAIENKETAREEWCKKVTLWRIAIDYGFVFDDHDFIRALKTAGAK